jgi:hypothetical protein
MKYFACFNWWSKSRLPANTLLGLLIVAVIALGCNQAARSLAHYLYDSGNNECTLVDVSLSSGYAIGTARPVKNNTGKNHSPLLQNFAIALQVFNGYVHSPCLFVAGYTCSISLSWRQLQHTYFLQDLPPPYPLKESQSPLILFYFPGVEQLPGLRVSYKVFPICRIF